MKKVDWPRIDSVTLARLRRPRPALALCLLMLNCGAYLGLSWVTLRINAWWMVVVAAPIQALILCGLFSIVHDCVHGAFFKSRNANEALGRVVAAVVATNFSFYKAFHIEHHASATLPNDPEGMVSLRNIGDYLRFLVVPAFFLSMWAEVLRVMRGHRSRFVRKPETGKAVAKDAMGVALWLAAVCFLAFVAPRVVVFGYLLPLALFFPIMNLTSLPEHFATRPGRSVIGNTRSTDSNRLFTLLFWFNNLHAEHHAYPSVPSYNLPQLRVLIGHEFLFRERSYLRFHARLLAKLRTRGSRQHDHKPRE